MKTTGSNSWVATLCIAGGAAAYVWWVFLPEQKAIAALNAELREKQSYAVNLATFTNQIESTQREFTVTRAYIDERRRLLVTPADMPRLYAEIAAVAKQAEVVTTRFSPDVAVPFGQMQRFPINLGCQGSFAQLSQLIEGLERLPYQLWLEDVTFEADAEDEQVLRCEINLGVFAKISGSSG